MKLFAPCGAAQIPEHAVAIDINPHYLVKSRAASPAGVRFVIGDLNRLPFRAQRFTYVNCWNVLEHLDSKVQVIREIWRVSSPGAELDFSAGIKAGMDKPDKIIDISQLEALEPINRLSGSQLAELAKKLVIEELSAAQFLFQIDDLDQQNIYLLDGEVELLDDELDILLLELELELMLIDDELLELEMEEVDELVDMELLLLDELELNELELLLLVDTLELLVEMVELLLEDEEDIDELDELEVDKLELLLELLEELELIELDELELEELELELSRHICSSNEFIMNMSNLSPKFPVDAPDGLKASIKTFMSSE